MQCKKSIALTFENVCQRLDAESRLAQGSYYQGVSVCARGGGGGCTIFVLFTSVCVKDSVCVHLNENFIYTYMHRSVLVRGCVLWNTIGMQVRLFVQECVYTSSQECVYVHIFTMYISS